MAIFKNKPDTFIEMVPMFNLTFHRSYIPVFKFYPKITYSDFLHSLSYTVYLVILIHLHHWLSTALERNQLLFVGQPLQGFTGHFRPLEVKRGAQ